MTREEIRLNYALAAEGLEVSTSVGPGGADSAAARPAALPRGVSRYPPGPLEAA
jgi:hypothetical protein